MLPLQLNVGYIQIVVQLQSFKACGISCFTLFPKNSFCLKKWKKKNCLKQVADPTFLKVSPLSPDFLQRQVCLTFFLSSFNITSFFFPISELDIIWVGNEITCRKVEKSSRCTYLTLRLLSAHKHLLNAGFEFEVVTFEKTGCVGVGSWTPEASWYPGYLWKACICPKCR